MQYLLVGLSLVLFYLVLLALSEHIGFTASWIAASLWARDEWDVSSGGAERMA
jgi:inner membrane protein involved in colicin E2 resistance